MNDTMPFENGPETEKGRREPGDGTAARGRPRGTRLWGPVSALLLGTLLVLGAGLASKAGSAEHAAPSHPRLALFATSQVSPLREVLEQPSRLTVLFHPSPGQCTPQEIEVAAALRRLERDLPGIAVYTVLPDGLPEPGEYEAPGRALRLPIADYQREEEVAPRPRLEAWSSEGELLLMRSLPRSVREEAIYEEVLWSRAFTEDPGEARSF